MAWLAWMYFDMTTSLQLLLLWVTLLAVTSILLYCRSTFVTFETNIQYYDVCISHEMSVLFYFSHRWVCIPLLSVYVILLYQVYYWFSIFHYGILKGTCTCTCTMYLRTNTKLLIVFQYWNSYSVASKINTNTKAKSQFMIPNTYFKLQLMV